MKIFDSHFHYYGETAPQEFYHTVLAELEVPPQSDAGRVERIFVNAVGGDYLESCRAREFAQVVKEAFFSVGVHPHQADEFLAAPQEFGEFRGHEKLVAIGELGLDYYYEQSDREAQKQVFRRFLDLALEWGLPAIVHIRDKEEADAAYSDAYELLAPFAQAGGKFVVHCFAGSVAWAEKFLALGAYLGVRLANAHFEYVQSVNKYTLNKCSA